MPLPLFNISNAKSSAPNPGPWQTSQEELVLRRRRILEKHSRSPGKHYHSHDNILLLSDIKCSFFPASTRKRRIPLLRFQESHQRRRTAPRPLWGQPWLRQSSDNLVYSVDSSHSIQHNKLISKVACQRKILKGSKNEPRILGDPWRPFRQPGAMIFVGTGLVTDVTSQ